MEQKQLTKLIRKYIGKESFPFDNGTLKGAFRIISIKEMGYNYGDGISWVIINVEVDLEQDKSYYMRWLERGRKQLVTRRRNADLYWLFNTTSVPTMLKFFNIKSVKLGKVTYKKKTNVRKDTNLNSILETSKESSSVLC
jgi:hypothetical protein